MASKCRRTRPQPARWRAHAWKLRQLPPRPAHQIRDLIWTETNGIPSTPLSAGPVIFAGEHLSDAYPGYMNGGAQTGRLAAQSVIAARAPARRVG